MKNLIHLPALITGLALMPVCSATAQTFTLLKSFSALSDGVFPSGGLTLNAGLLYGVNRYGGLSNAGTIFKVGTNGDGFTVIHHFAGGSDGEYANGRVVVSGNTIYGVLRHGGNINVNNGNGIEGGGTIYRVNTDGSNYSILRKLDAAIGDGVKPVSGMVLSGSTLYGITTGGGVSGAGTVFKINTNGTGYQNLHSFDVFNGAQPEAELTLIGSTLYGTTAFSQLYTSGGAIFKIGLDGTGFTVLYNVPQTFSLLGTGRLTPVGNQFYGVGSSYEANGTISSVYKINTNGSGFQIVGQLPSGYFISDALTWTGSELLGTCAWGGVDVFEMIFQMKTNGTSYRVLKTLDGSGATSWAGEFALNGTTVYGASFSGGEFNAGTVFSFDVRPRLAIAAAGGGVKISWPTYAYDYQLEQNPTLATAGWTNVTTAPVDDGTNWTITLPAPAASNPVFHRLRR